jgi:microcystin degradation protein MlrC
MKDFIDLAHRIESEKGIVNATVSGGFPYADIRDAGVSVVVTTDNNPKLAAEKAKEIGDQIWNRRNEFEVTLTPVKEAIQYAKEISKGPVILADGSDNPGGGAPCDGTVILQTFLEENVQDAVVAVIADPESVQKAIEAGVGNEIQLEVGGKTDDKHGKPVPMLSVVHLISDGCFVNKGPMGTGMKTNMGRTVVLKSGGVEVIITEKRVQVLDQELLKSVGITPADKKLIALKSSVHFRADFESIAQKIFEVDTPGVHSPDLFQYDYKKLRRPIFPLDVLQTDI